MKRYTKENIQEHPFDLFFAEDNPKYLVIGSFPTINRYTSYNFFYPNSINRFWTVVSNIFVNSKTRLNLNVSKNDNPIIKKKNEIERKNFCRENKIAMTDMFASCIRMDDNSKDKQLLLHRYNPIIDILKKHSSIERIILTAKSAGSSAHHHFYQYLVMNEIEFEYGSGKGKIFVDSRTVYIFSVDSTSSLNRHVNENDLIELYREAFNLT
ncbi:MAG: hypothetical protein WC150_10775 [Bacteroidia bacterium]